MTSHPSDEERAAAALPLVQRALAALAGSDAGALTEALREDAVVLTASGREEGARHVAFTLTGACHDATSWDPPRQHGAHALLAFTRADGSRSAILIESRRDAIVFAATLPG